MGQIGNGAGTGRLTRGPSEPGPPDNWRVGTGVGQLGMDEISSWAGPGMQCSWPWLLGTGWGMGKDHTGAPGVAGATGVREWN